MGYTFKQRETGNITFQPEKRNSYLYQICAFKDPNTNKYHIRKIIIDENLNIVNVYFVHANSKILKKVLKYTPINLYFKYPAYNFDLVPYPDNAQRHLSQSTILNTIPDNSFDNYSHF